TRQFVLMPNDNPNVNQFELRNNGPNAPEEQPQPNYGTQVQPVVAVVINRSTGNDTRFSLTMPVGGYDLGENHTAGAPLEGSGLIPIVNGENKPKDVPLDLETDEQRPLYTNDFVQNWRVVHLQRLANPLEAFNAETNP